MDMLGYIRDELLADDYISSQIGRRIRAYEYPATGDVSGPFIIIDPLDVPLPGDYADDTWLTDDYMYQVDVWTKNPHITKELARRVQLVMWDAGFPQTGGGADEYDKDTGIYRDARRYRGKAYRDDINI